MKAKKAFQCPIEDLPTIGEFIIESVKKDLGDFSSYSPVFTPAYLSNIELKIVACRKRVRSWAVIQELKATTELLNLTTQSLRVKLNFLEGYIKLSANELDVPTASMGLAAVRKSISHGSTESLIDAIEEMMIPVRRNISVLESKGLKESLLDEIEYIRERTNQLNLRQNELESERNRLTQENIEMFNELWQMIHPIFETGKALYRGTNAAKLKDYTLAQLIKRIHHAGRNMDKTKEDDQLTF